MDLIGTRIALYGRFLVRSKADAASAIAIGGGMDERDLTRRTTLLVIGAGARNLIPSGHLLRKIQDATQRGTPVIGEARFWMMQSGRTLSSPTYPIARISPIPVEGLAELLNAFDIVVLSEGLCRFGDVAILRAAMELLESGHELSSVVRILLRAKQVAPEGRHRLVATGGDARLQWDDVETELDGQGLLPLPDIPSLDDIFEDAVVAEAEGDLSTAVRGYELCVQMDRRDPIAPFNLGNILSAQKLVGDALRRYGQAIARDPHFSEAYYNRATLLESSGDQAGAERDLRAALTSDPTFLDAMFNLAQLRMRIGDYPEANGLFDRFLSRCEDSEWATIARRAKKIASAKMQAD